MTATAVHRLSLWRHDTTRGRRAIRLVAPMVAAGLVFGATIRIHSVTSGGHNSGAAIAEYHMPESAAIEQAWGIRITAVRLLASTGVVDLRYQVLDSSKADRLHPEGPVRTASLPVLRAAQGTVTPDSVMFHFHNQSDVAGQGFDIMYGNARGEVRAGDLVTIVMIDGLELADVPVGQ